MSKTTHTRTARLKDRSYIRSLAKQFAWAVGFLPDQAMMNRLEEGSIELALENLDPAGFILTAPHLGEAKYIRPIFQACVQMDAQRRHHGLNLLRKITAQARVDGKALLQCWCRQSLDANEFWRAAGFVKIALREVGATRGSPCILWRKPLIALPVEALAVMQPNTRNQSGAGRSLSKRHMSELPGIELFSPSDIELQLERLGLAA
jgi:N-acetylglutamate synthase-like GNAT family acetyltransferase